MGNMAVYVLEMSMIFATLNHYMSQYHGMIMLRGATNTSYVISRMIIDFISFVIFTQIFFALNTAFGVETEGW